MLSTDHLGGSTISDSGSLPSLPNGPQAVPAANSASPPDPRPSAANSDETSFVDGPFYGYNSDRGFQLRGALDLDTLPQAPPTWAGPSPVADPQAEVE
ncbi:hypothetical protein FRC10_001047, partial [Ceratobasidium sp. 414]